MDFFNDIEALSTKNNKKSIEYLKWFDFRSLYVLDPKLNLTLVEKNFLVLASILTLAIDKYGVDFVVKKLLPEAIQPAQTNLFYTVINWFLSLFRETKVSIKPGSNFNEALSEAMLGLRDLGDRKELPYTYRGEYFISNLNKLFLIVFKKYANPIKNTYIYPTKELEQTVSDKVSAAYQLTAGIAWWNDYSSTSASNPSTIVSSLSNNSIITDALQASSSAITITASSLSDEMAEADDLDDVLWPEEDWDEGEEEQANETFELPQSTNVDFSFQSVVLVDSNEILPPLSPQVLASASSPKLPPPPPPPSEPLIFSSFLLSAAKSDGDRAGLTVQTVKENPEGFLGSEIKGGNDDSHFVASCSREWVVDSGIGTSSESSYQSDVSDSDESVTCNKEPVETLQQEKTAPPASIASQAMNDELIILSSLVTPLGNETLSASNTVASSFETESELRQKPALRPKPKVVLNKINKGEVLAVADSVVEQSYSENEEGKQIFSQNNVAALLAKSLEKVVSGTLANKLDVSSQPLSQVGRVTKVN